MNNLFHVIGSASKLTLGNGTWIAEAIGRRMVRLFGE